MGSTTYELARATMIPLLINKDEEDEVTENLLDTVLIPTDFSRKSLEALNVIRSLREYVGKYCLCMLLSIAETSMITKKNTAVPKCFCKSW